MMVDHLRGWQVLLYKEILRFWKVGLQTIAAPVLTAMLYLLIFGHVLGASVQVYPGVSYLAFLVPGLVMMSVLQNAFANSSSSLIQSKIMGNLVFSFAHAAVALGLVWRVFAVFHFAGFGGGRWGAGGGGLVCAFAIGRAVVDSGFCRAGCGFIGQFGRGGWFVGGEVRPNGNLPKLHHRAHDFFKRGVLLPALAAAAMVADQPFQPVFLFD